MMNVERLGNPSAHGIQCGTAHVDRGENDSPSQPRFITSFAARTDWSNRMFWFTASVILASAHRFTRSFALATESASGFWARMPRSRPSPSSTARGSIRVVRPAARPRPGFRSVGRGGSPQPSRERWRAMLLRDFARGRRITRSDGDGVEPRDAIRDEVTVAHDEPSPDATDSQVLAPRQPRAVVQVDLRGEG